MFCRPFPNALALAAGAAAVLLGSTPAGAQSQEGTKPPVPHQQIVSANPFGLMLRWWNVEFERKSTPSSTWGVSTSFLTLEGLDYASVNALYRYYPQGAALSGFFLGGRAGLYHGSDEDNSGMAFGLGFEIGYTWLLGAHRNVGLSLGAGVTRIVAGDFLDGPSALPTVRLLNVGIAF
jgi:opacity protein-like surface antigen